MASRFIHLHTHSHFSFLQALPKIPELVQAAREQEMGAIALTDAENMHGAIEFYKYATKKGIKPIIGVDLYVAPRSRFQKDPLVDTKRSRIVLLAENNIGYKNLLSLVTKSYLEGFFERSRIDRELLNEKKDGLIALIPSFAGNVAQLIRTNDNDGAAAALDEYKNIFGHDNVFLEISHHPKVKGHSNVMKQIVALSQQSGVPVIAQHDVYYISPDDREPTEIMRRIQHGEHGYHEDEDFSFTNEKQMLKYFKEIPDTVFRSGDIANRCNVSLDLGSWIFPDVPVDPQYKDHVQELKAKTYAGIVTRNLSQTKEIIDRIEYELSIINKKGFAPYFLAVADLLLFAKRSDILTTTRGSAAGSLVSYLIGISNIDPIFYKLPFERFLNPERPKAPDIDMDIADNRRDEMIEYAKKHYGKDKVTQIGTFGTMMARAAVRDVARALGHPYSVGDRIAKLIPLGSQGFPMTINHALELEPELKENYDNDEDVHYIINIAKRIEGCVRHVGVHAAGVVIAPTPLIEWTPMQLDPKGGKLITQYDMYSIIDEYGGIGLLKFDFLGIKNLSILADTVKHINKDTTTTIDIEKIPIDDKKTFEMLARGETEGVFQLSGSGITHWLKDLKPTTIHDINAMVALYRPGPMEVIPAYIERKNNPNLIKYLDPRMEIYLKESYGLLVYQDDLLYSAVYLAGYTWGEVDKFRKAIGKKKPKEMAAQKEKFTKGIVTNGQTEDFANKLWKLFEPFQAYGFNKAHAASYGRVAYQTAYLKANYTVEYMTALLTADAGDVEKVAIFVAECTRLGISVLPPDINESDTIFTVVDAPSDISVITHDKAIRFGLSSIKNFGDGISEAILAERTAHGSYKSLIDFLSRIEEKSLTRKSMEALIKSGALDSFGDRGLLLANMETLLTFHRESTKKMPQNALFSAQTLAPTLTMTQPAINISFSEKLRWEKELLGIYVSGYPLDAHATIVAKSKITINDICTNPQPGMPIIIPVLVNEIRTILTKKGEKMAFARFEDKTGSIEAVLFPKLLKEYSNDVQPGICLLVKGNVSNRNGEVSLNIDGIKRMEEPKK